MTDDEIRLLIERATAYHDAELRLLLFVARLMLYEGKLPKPDEKKLFKLIDDAAQPDLLAKIRPVK